MSVELLDDKKLWDQFVENSPQGTLFHMWDFLKIVEKHSGFQLLPYAIFSGDKLRCIFPFFLMRRLGLTAMFSPPPHADVPYLGFAFDPSVAGLKASKKETIVQQVMNEVCTEIDKISPNFVNFYTVPSWIDVRAFEWKNHSVRLMFTYSLDLEKPLQDIWESFSKRCRKDINRLNALSPHVEHTHDISLVLRLYRQRMNELGIKPPIFSDSYFEEVTATFPQRVTVHSVSIDGGIAGATAWCALREDRYGLWIGNVNARRDLTTNDFLTWGVIQHAKSEGFKTLDFIGASRRPSLNMWKSKFDPVLEPYCYVHKSDTLGKIAMLVYSKLADKQILPRLRGRKPRGACSPET